jgi:predicted RNase H-like HicB family nuclease
MAESLDDLLTRQYPIRTVVNETGGWSIWFSDLPGCMSHAETLAEIGAHAAIAFRLWIEAEHVAGRPIPAPTVDRAGDSPFWSADELRAPVAII